MIDNEIQIFNFENNEIRALNIDDKPYFVGKDVADILGYADQNKALQCTLMMKINSTTKRR